MRQYRGLTKDGKWVYGWYVEKQDTHYNPYSVIINDKIEDEVIPETVGQQVGFGDIYAGDYCVMDCWNGGDGIEEPDHHDIFEGIIVYDKRICRWGLQTNLCDEGQIEVGLEDNRFTEIEILGNCWENPKLMDERK